MNAAPILIRVARVLRETGLEAVMIGNAAAALEGAPVTTIDVDFFFRKTPANLVTKREFTLQLESPELLASGRPSFLRASSRVHGINKS